MPRQTHKQAIYLPKATLHAITSAGVPIPAAIVPNTAHVATQHTTTRVEQSAEQVTPSDGPLN